MPCFPSPVELEDRELLLGDVEGELGFDDDRLGLTKLLLVPLLVEEGKLHTVGHAVIVAVCMA